MKPKISELILTLVLSSMILGILVYTISTRYIPIPSMASVKAVGVGIYWDAGLTKAVSSLNWGIIEPGEKVNQSIYIQNVGNVPVTIGLTTQNWNPPEASKYITLTWNYTEQTINANDAIPVTLTLSVSLDVMGFTNFSFDIIISAVG